MNFSQLTNQITTIHKELQSQAAQAVNRALTIRNWLIGFYIVEFEQNGEDRAKYGDKLLQNLANTFQEQSLSQRNLRLYRPFYLTYPHIWQTVVAKINKWPSNSIFELLSPEDVEKRLAANTQKWQSAIAKSEHLNTDISITGEKILSKLSFTHLVQLFSINDPLKRTFYEVECIKGNWSVRELKRQIESQYFERSGISKNPEKLSELTLQNSEQTNIQDIIKSPFTFEFLGLNAKDVVEESDLEQALIDNLQAFLLELGRGFCFEARQKRILIDDEYYFVDLVFYHRLLKCHVLVELKTEKFKPAHLAQLNSYVAYYRNEVMETNDRQPVGILICAEKGEKLVEYALSGMDQQLFVNQYKIELPSKAQLEEFIQEQLKRL